MDKLDFYYVDNGYAHYLKTVEQKKRGFSRVPNMDDTGGHKPKFLCGVVLTMNGIH